MIGQILNRLIGPVFNVIDQKIEDVDLRNQLKAEVQSQILNNEAEITGYLRDIVVAEAQGESWLQRNWRPLLMLTFTAIVANNYILSPYLAAMFGWSVVLDPPADLWDLLKIGVGGYIVGRSAEKITDTYTSNTGGRDAG